MASISAAWRIILILMRILLFNVRLQARAARGASLCKPLLGGTLCDSA
jgi:hypothetical protein